MRIEIAIPIHIDDPLTSAERAKFRQALESQIVPIIEDLTVRELTPEPRMYGTLCRWAFGKPQIKVR